MEKNFWYKYLNAMHDFVSHGGNKDLIPADELVELANCYYKGDLDIPRNQQVAKELYYLAMKKGSKEAARKAMLYSDPGPITGSITDSETGEKITDPDKINEILGSDSPVAKEGSELFELAKIAAATGDVDCQYNLAVMYGLMGDYENAFKWYHISAENFNVNAMSRLAMYYAYGHGCETNLVLAAYWIFIRSTNYEIIDDGTKAEINNTAFYLADQLEFIEKHDHTVTLKAKDREALIVAAKDAGERDAYNLLIVDDNKINEEILKKAVEFGHPYAQFAYALWSREKGDEGNYIKYIQLACDQDFTPAQCDFVSYMYSNRYDAGGYIYTKFKDEDIEKLCLQILTRGTDSKYKKETDTAYQILTNIYRFKDMLQRALFCYKCTGVVNDKDNEWVAIEQTIFKKADNGVMYGRRFKGEEPPLKDKTPDHSTFIILALLIAFALLVIICSKFL